MKKLLIFCLLLACSGSVLAEKEQVQYLCTITETIQAKFKHGKWTNTSIYDGKGSYRVLLDSKKAAVFELVPERNKSYPVKTSCSYGGGTAGYRCEEFTKIIPYGENYQIYFNRDLEEITISARYSMREFDAYSDAVKGDVSNYFKGMTIGITESYGKCIESGQNQ